MNSNFNYKAKLYFWINNTVVEESAEHHHTKWRDGWKGSLCVDMREHKRSFRYGKWRKEEEHWDSISFDDFPKEFKLQLLLLGVDA